MTKQPNHDLPERSTHLERYRFDDPASVQEFIEDEQPGIYHGANENGETVMLTLLGEGEFPLQLRTHQANGWYRINEYDREGEHVGEMYEPGNR